jgi:hypothetical protein
VGLQTSDDFRFLKSWWEITEAKDWQPYTKGGEVSLLYQEISLVVRTRFNFAEIVSFTNDRYPYLNGNARSLMHADMANFGCPGITWTKSTTRHPSFRLMPAGCVFSVSGLAAFVESGEESEILYVAALMNSAPFKYLISLSLGLAAEGRKHYETGLVNKNPEPEVDPKTEARLAELAEQAWQHRYRQFSADETSRAFTLPLLMQERLGWSDPHAAHTELESIQAEIDSIAFALYGFSKTDRAEVLSVYRAVSKGDAGSDTDDEGDDEEGVAPIADIDGLLSWAVGVAFGRFDWRLSIGQRAAPTEPKPFDPLPAKSPGMLPSGLDPFHDHSGVLVDDPGHPHDLADLAEEVLIRVDAPVPGDLRRWLQKDFFPFHLQRYSKSRRKAPIYWPLATASGSYTLWLYYPSLSSQTLYTAINDFLDGPSGKLTQVAGDVAALRSKGSARTRDEERRFESLENLELELIELRDQLLKIAPTYQPNRDDGVQITAAPLWPMFRHKPWQKILKETWAKLEKGDYDWAHLAMNYWPDRVREKCKTDKSLAIAHGLEHLYVEPEAQPKKAGGRKKKGGSA